MSGSTDDALLSGDELHASGDAVGEPQAAAPAVRPLGILGVPAYASELKPGPNRRELIVLMSSSAQFMMRGRPFSRDVLYVAPQNARYYLTNPQLLADAIIALSTANGYERTLFVGGSKSGFGALLVASLAARSRPDLFFRALAFSPQTVLYPIDETLSFPSYRKLAELALVKDRLMNQLRRHGDLRRLAKQRNMHATIVYPALSVEDSRQAAMLSGPNIRKYPLHTDLHNTPLFFLIRSDEQALREKVNKIYARSDDLDIVATRPRNLEETIGHFLDATWLPSYDALLDEVISVEPPPLRDPVQAGKAPRVSGG